MGERRTAYSADLKCSNPACGRMLAKITNDGGLEFDGMPVMAISGKCPNCQTPFMYPSLGLEIGTTGISQLVRAISLIQTNNGFGVLRVTFERFKARRIGFEAEADCRDQ